MTESVRVDPGAMVLTRLPWGPKATAQDRVNDSSAALAAAETTAPPTSPDEANAPEMLTMTPRSAGDHFWQQRRGEEERRPNGDVERHVERVDVLLQCRSVMVRGRVVHQHVDLTGLFGQASYRCDVVQVGDDELGASTLGLDRRDGLRTSFGVAPGEDHGRAAAGAQAAD